MRLSSHGSQTLQAFAAQSGVTLNTLALAAWGMLISSFTGESEVILGTVRSYRRSLPESLREVAIVAADICVEEQLTNALSEARDRFGRISGVIHAAGRVDPHMTASLTWKKAAEILGPKVQGTELLANALKSDDPDFVIFCSSLDAIRGSFSQANYCAANAFLDAFAQHMHQKGQRYLSINWDLWSDVAMAASVDVPGSLKGASHKSWASACQSKRASTFFDVP